MFINFLKKNEINDLMIINIVKDLNGYYKILFTKRFNADGEDFKGLMIISFKTKNGKLFNEFRNYGEWINEKNKYHSLLLCLFKQAKQNTTPFDLL